jgi:hypothetical protein
MNSEESRALQDIEQYGCHVLQVLEDAIHPRFSYSIGIEQTTGHPELIVTGLQHELAASIINEYCSRLKAGESFQPNYAYSGFLEGFDVVLKQVNPKHYREYFGWALWLYKGSSFRVFQLVYPSTQGVWPWDPEAPDDYLWFLPHLYDD